jgi:hypothetical protein
VAEERVQRRLSSRLQTPARGEKCASVAVMEERMAHNTQRITRGQLTIKYSPEYPIGAPEVDKLVNSLDLARHVVAKSFNLIHKLELPPRQAASVPSHLAYEPGVRRSPRWMKHIEKLHGNTYFEKMDPMDILSISYHFGLSIDESSAYFWPGRISQIASRYSKILAGLQQSLSIADAHATIIGKKVDKAITKWKKRGEEEDVLLDRMQKAFEKGAADSAKTRGVVNPKKAFLMGLTETQFQERDSMRIENDEFVPYIDMAPEDRGSIHINFMALLRPEKSVTDLGVARTIIHEASHKFCNTQDYAYASPEMVYDRTPSHQKLWNADSYAFCAVSLYTGTFIATDDDMPAA